MKSVDDLNKLRDRARKSLTLRNGEAGARVIVAMGTCGIASGARDVLMAVMDELTARGLSDVVVSQTGCRGLCEREPMMEVQKPGLPTVTYGDLDVEKAKTIVAEHLGQGVIVEEWVITQASRPKPSA
ncbi:MAG: (2Fe-2S) ferredoxin domain-containing protein [Armatimonadota bacterium]|jgi:(2Fe-2S) ferredoxin